jgi:hypothetical protein
MAETLEVVLIHQWPLFTVYDTDGTPLIGGRLHTYAANTSTPKATYADPYLLTPNANPVILDAMGQAVIWLDGFYKLRLENREGVQLWEIDSYEYPSVTEPPTSGMVSGYNEGVVSASPGASVLQVPNLVPLGYRCKGVICKVNTAFGTSSGLTAILIGDADYNDGWGQIGLSVGLQTSQVDFHRGDQPIIVTAYTILLSALGGTFDAGGEMAVRAFWESITGWA